MRLQATQEGLAALKTWIKNALDQVIQVSMGEPDLEFAWIGDDGVDPLQQAQTLQILVSAGIKTREEARAELGLGGDKAAAGLGKYNQKHDGRGRFATAEGASEVVGNPARRSARTSSQLITLPCAPRRLRHRAEGVVARAGPPVPGLFRRHDERRRRSAADAPIHVDIVGRSHRTPAAFSGIQNIVPFFRNEKRTNS